MFYTEEDTPLNEEEAVLLKTVRSYGSITIASDKKPVLSAARSLCWKGLIRMQLTEVNIYGDSMQASVNRYTLLVV